MGRPKKGSSNPVGHPWKYRSCKELRKAIDGYFATATGSLTLSSLARHLGVDVRTLVNYAHNQELFPAIRDAKLKISEYYELHGQTVKNPSFAIFMLKNLGFTDQVQVEHSGTVDNIVRFPIKAPVGSTVDALDSNKPSGAGS